MAKMFQNKSATFYINLLTLLLVLVGTVCFALSYMTGYVSIVYGMNNSIIITLMLAGMIMISALIISFQIMGKVRVKEVYNVSMYILVILLTLSAGLLLADRVEAIGNCIIAPWDAGHGGEESCYLAFVSMGCWLVAVIANIVGTFMGYKEKT